MHIEIDKFAYLDTFIHKWDPRFKIASLFALLVSFSFVHFYYLAIAILFASFVLFFCSQIHFSHISNRLKYPFWLLVLLLVLLMTTSGGEKLYSIWKIIIFKDGLKLGLIILIRSLAQLLILFVILETTPFTQIIKALYLLKIPEKLVSIVFFTIKYIYIYLEKMRKLTIAAKLRGKNSKSIFANFVISSGIIGSLMVRSFEQAERVHAAMVLRGYCGEMLVHHQLKATWKDYVKTIVTLIATILVIGLSKQIWNPF